jgi:hypothetical protein
MTFGRCGLFSLYPVLLAGVAAALRAVTSPRLPNRGPILLGFCAFGLLTAYYCVTTNNYGGESYGFRWYIPAMPLLLLMAAPMLNETHARWRWAVVIVMFAVSGYSAFEAARTDWQASQEWTCQILGPSV